MNHIKIENWSVITDSSPYTPPEYQKLYIKGIFPDGKIKTTSAIQSVNGKVIQTQHNMYVLGSPDPSFVEFCKLNNVHIPTEEIPILVK